MEMFAELNRLQRAWRVFPPRAGQVRDMEHHYRAALADPDAVLLVAEDEGEVVGMAAGNVHRPSTMSDKLAVEISSVYVRLSHRRRGLAKALAAEVARFARGRGVDRITLKTFAQNAEALEAWRRMGFEPRMVQMTAPVEWLDRSEPLKSDG
jgi:GNAT superfamily N-acetyltransferase